MAKLSKSKTRIPAADASAANGVLVPTGYWLNAALEFFRVLREVEIQRRSNARFFDSHSATSCKSRIIEEYFDQDLR